MIPHPTIQNISESTKLDIMSNYVEPAYKQDVIELLQGKRCWRITAQTFETISKVFVAVGSIVSFASGVYNEPNLSFIAGTISTVSLATLQFASFGFRENKKQSSALNTLLSNIDIKAMPVIDRSSDATFRQSSQTDNVNNGGISYHEYERDINALKEEIIHRAAAMEELQSKIVQLTEGQASTLPVDTNNVSIVVDSDHIETVKLNES